MTMLLDCASCGIAGRSGRYFKCSKAQERDESLVNWLALLALFMLGAQMLAGADIRGLAGPGELDLPARAPLRPRRQGPF